MIKKVLSLFVLLFLSSYSLYSQSVGLVLSGGGAKGLYHIGILKALEQNDIPIDYVAGTSMGSIVAGMYSAGYSPEEMEAIFMGPEVSYWVSGKVEDKYLYYYKKLPPTPAMVSLDLNFSQIKPLYTSQHNPLDSLTSKNKKRKFVFNKPQMPGSSSQGTRSSLINATPLDVGMVYFFSAASAHAKNNFDSLFVPFRCVSTDIYTKKEYVWKEGDLGMAIRASMAIPIVFKPIEIDSMLMYDGGLVNNFPWKEVVEDFNPDVIIGGQCVSGKPDVSTLTGQIEMLIMSPTDYDLPEDKGVMISRNIDVGMLDFKRAEYVIQRGYDDAMAAMPQIKERIQRRVSSKDVYMRRLKFKEDTPALMFDKFSVEGLTPAQRKYVVSQLDSRDTTAGINFDEFKTNYFKILSENFLEGEFPTIAYQDSSGYFDVGIKMNNKPSFKVMVGANISSTAANQGYVGVQYRDLGRVSTIYMLDGYLGPFYSSAQVGSRINFYGNKPVYIESFLCYNFFDYARGNSQSITSKYTDFGYSRYNDVYLSSLIGMPVQRMSKFELRLAIGHDSYGYLQSGGSVSNGLYDKSRFNFVTLNAEIKRNSLNFLMYATRGLRQSFSIFGLYRRETFIPGAIATSSGNYSQKYKDLWAGASFSREDYLPVAKHFTFGYSVDVLFSNKQKLSNDYITKMVSPAFAPTPHSETIYTPDLRNTSYVAVGVKPIIELNDNIYLKSEFYCYMPDLTSYSHVNEKLKFLASAALVYQSPIGPVSFAYSHYDISGLKKDYFTFNFGYILFNKQGIKY